MRFKRVREEETTLGIAALIDIVFLLLIFFMVTSNFDVASGVRIRLPDVTRKVFDEQEKRITLIIDSSGQATLEGNRIDADALRKRLAYLVKEKGLVQLILQADKEVDHGVVVEAMDIAKTAGVQSIMVAARWKSDKVF